MKKLILIFLFLGIAMLYDSCSDNNPSAPGPNQSNQMSNTLVKKSDPNLIGSTDANFVAGTQGDVAWDGTIEFDVYGTYGIRFHHTGGAGVLGQVNHGEEYFEIYDLGNPTFVYLSGPDEGVVPLANKPPEPVKFILNGKVEVANGPFEMWLDRNVHMRGIVEWDPLTGRPLKALGVFRIN